MSKHNYIDIIKNLSQKKLSSEEVAKFITKNNSIPKNGNSSKSMIIEAYKELKQDGDLALSQQEELNFKHNIRMKRVRTLSGVTTVTVLTAPYYCPGKCIFCPSDVKMPKSYLSDEPGAQRALSNQFDPYLQTFSRLKALENIGHPVNKVELIVLGGTWSVYPTQYQIWFIKRCFDALNDFPNESNLHSPQEFSRKEIAQHFSGLNETDLWKDLFRAHHVNETSKSRCVGLSIETRPDEINDEEVVKIRKLGATKIQLGIQSLQDEVLHLNCRGHDVKKTQEACRLIRSMGFKLQVHWMANLLGSTPKADLADYKKMFEDSSILPDEVKIYPCSLIKNSPLYQYYLDGKWKSYSDEELKQVVASCIVNTPRWCRLSRVFRDIPSQYIEVGVKATNFRQIAENYVDTKESLICEIRHREIRESFSKDNDLHLKITEYVTSISKEYFIEFVNDQDKIVGFLRLSLPIKQPFYEELQNCAIIREIHVYGQSIEISHINESGVQHLGLGESLINKAIEISQHGNYQMLAVISAIGTREYYRKKGFSMGNLYMFKKL
jgi:elongator complex protein 3